MYPYLGAVIKTPKKTIVCRTTIIPPVAPSIKKLK
jgi:hypothetical protein